MKQFLLGMFVILAVAGCKKEAAVPAGKSLPQTDDLTTFLELKYLTFEGEMNGSFFTKTDGAYGYFSSTGWFNGDTDGICYPNDPHRCVVSGLTEQGGGSGSFELYSPRYNSASDTEWIQTFSPGKKKLGAKVRDFYLSMNVGNDIYETTNACSNNEIEILKTEPFTDAAGQKLRVWFTLSASLIASGTGGTSNLSNGMMIAEFSGYKP